MYVKMCTGVHFLPPLPLTTRAVLPNLVEMRILHIYLNFTVCNSFILKKKIRGFTMFLEIVEILWMLAISNEGGHKQVIFLALLHVYNPTMCHPQSI